MKILQSSERQIEAGIAAEDAARAREIARIRAQMVLKGDEYCMDCGDEIGTERRAALPSAMRCIACQNIFERVSRR
ncbi:MAG: TraR/DksA C4-type zinc finger protein [Sphingomonadaceae bacterium]